MRIRRLAPLTALTAIAALALPASGQASINVTATGTVTGSTLSVSTSASPSFSADLDNGDSTPTYTIPLTIQDTRGTGAGWNETITSTQFTTGSPNNYTLATNASTVTNVAEAPGSGTNTTPSNSVSTPVAVPAGSGPPTAVKFYDAATGSGMGKFTITPTIGVFVPQNSYAGTYTSTITLAMVTGP